MRLANVLHLYRVRLRARAAAGAASRSSGIAAGVALLFASQVASSSLSSSVAQLSQRDRRQSHACSCSRATRTACTSSLLEQVRHIPGVRVAAPLLEATANAIGPKGSESVELVGADSSLTELGGALVARRRTDTVRGSRRGRAARAARARRSASPSSARK